jgi:predicted glycoside hydrolase/deacetylase ChbG (UPF0249 family)
MSHCYDFEVEQAFSLYGKLLDELLDAHGTQEEDRCRMRVHPAFVAYTCVLEVRRAFSLYGKLLDELVDAHGTQEEDRCRMRVHAAFVAYMTVKEKMDAYSVRVPGAH